MIPNLTIAQDVSNGLKKQQVSNEQKTLVIWGVKGIKLPSYVGVIINRCKDLY